MAAFKRGDRWHYRKWVRLPDGGRERVFGTPSINTKASALVAERAHIERLLNPPPPPPKVVPTVEEYAEQWLTKRTNANASDDRTRIERHALPALGVLRLD